MSTTRTTGSAARPCSRRACGSPEPWARSRAVLERQPVSPIAPLSIAAEHDGTERFRCAGCRRELRHRFGFPRHEAAACAVCGMIWRIDDEGALALEVDWDEIGGAEVRIYRAAALEGPLVPVELLDEEL